MAKSCLFFALSGSLTFSARCRLWVQSNVFFTHAPSATITYKRADQQGLHPRVARSPWWERYVKNSGRNRRFCQLQCMCGAQRVCVCVWFVVSLDVDWLESRRETFLRSFRRAESLQTFCPNRDFFAGSESFQTF